LLPDSSQPVVAIEPLGSDGRFWEMQISARPAEMGRSAAPALLRQVVLTGSIERFNAFMD
jgi:hypothetical protein